MGGAEPGVEPGFPALVLPALDAVVAKDREPRTPALSPFLLLSSFLSREAVSDANDASQ
jgi:hypothetical protein